MGRSLHRVSIPKVTKSFSELIVGVLNTNFMYQKFKTHSATIPVYVQRVTIVKAWVCSECHFFVLDATNNLSQPPLISHSEFYNESLDNVDLFREYNNWQNPTNHGGFSFCQYPFLLSITAKRFILQKDSETQMINQARVGYHIATANHYHCVTFNAVTAIRMHR